MTPGVQPPKMRKAVKASVARQPKQSHKTSMANLVHKSEQEKVNKFMKEEIKTLRKAQTTKVSRAAKTLLANLALPSDAQPVRIGSSLGSDPTALARPKARYTVNYPNGAGVFDVPQTSSPSFLFRDPLRSLVHVASTTASDDFNTYVADAQLDVPNCTDDIYPRYLTPFVDQLDLNNSYHGPNLYCGILGESDIFRWFPVSKGQQVSVSVLDPAPAIGVLSLQLFKLEGKTPKLIETLTFPALPSSVFAAIGASGSGYYAVRFNVSMAPISGAPAPLNVKITLTSTSVPTLWAHKASPGIEDNLANIKTFSVLGASLMYTNTASPLNRQGKIVARELPAKSNWLDYLNFDQVANLSLAEVKDAPEGMYAFTRPNAGTFGSFKTLVYDATDEVEEYLYTILPDEPFVIIHASVATTAGQDGYLTLNQSIEYTSTSQWIEQKIGEMSNDDVKIALRLLSSMPQFHENPLHFDDVWSWIKDTASNVWSAVKDVAPYVAAVAPLLL